MSCRKTIVVQAVLKDASANPTAELCGAALNGRANLPTNVRYNAVDDYELLKNRPLIEEVTLSGNKTFKQLGLSPASKVEVEAILQS